MAVIDIESTSTEVIEARIIEFAVTVIEPDMAVSIWSCLCNPGVPIPPAAIAIHGYTNEMVKDWPPFSEFAAKIWRGLQGKDIGGYNVRRYDLPLLDEELRRCGMALDMTGVRVIDAFGIYSKKDPRSLSDAVRKYCNREHDDAHGAVADSKATADVLFGQLEAHPDIAEMDMDALAAYSRTSEFDYVDLAGKLYRDAEGVLRFGFGKHKDKPVMFQLEYVHWMIEKANFPGSTIEVLEDELARLEAERTQADHGICA